MTITQQPDLRALTLKRAALEAETPALMTRSTGEHWRLCREIAAIKRAQGVDLAYAQGRSASRKRRKRKEAA